MACCAIACCFSRPIVASWVASLFRGIDGDRVIAVVDLGEDVAGADCDVVLDRNSDDDPRDLRRYHGEVGLHIGIVGRNIEPALRPPIVTIIAATPRRGDHAEGSRYVASWVWRRRILRRRRLGRKLRPPRLRPKRFCLRRADRSLHFKSSTKTRAPSSNMRSLQIALRHV